MQMICPEAKECNHNSCHHRIPHEEKFSCLAGTCGIVNTCGLTNIIHLTCIKHIADIKIKSLRERIAESKKESTDKQSKEEIRKEVFFELLRAYRLNLVDIAIKRMSKKIIINHGLLVAASASANNKAIDECIRIMRNL